MSNAAAMRLPALAMNGGQNTFTWAKELAAKFNLFGGKSKATPPAPGEPLPPTADAFAGMGFEAGPEISARVNAAAKNNIGLDVALSYASGGILGATNKYNDRSRTDAERAELQTDADFNTLKDEAIKHLIATIDDSNHVIEQMIGQDAWLNLLGAIASTASLEVTDKSNLIDLAVKAKIRSIASSMHRAA